MPWKKGQRFQITSDIKLIDEIGLPREFAGTIQTAHISINGKIHFDAKTRGSLNFSNWFIREEMITPISDQVSQTNNNNIPNESNNTMYIWTIGIVHNPLPADVAKGATPKMLVKPEAVFCANQNSALIGLAVKHAKKLEGIHLDSLVAHIRQGV